MRDWLRRQLGLIPSIDLRLADARVGDGIPSQPYPSNELLNQAIENACHRINRETGLADLGGNISVDIPAQTQSGPYILSLNELTNRLPEQSITEVRRAWWKSGDNLRGLQPKNPQELMREMPHFQQYGPSHPLYYGVEGYRLYLFPAPVSMGVLVIACGSALFAPQTDMDNFDFIPLDLYPAVLYNALVDLGKIMVDDIEMRDRASAFAKDAEEGLDAILRWLARVNQRSQARVYFKGNYRCGWVGMR